MEVGTLEELAAGKMVAVETTPPPTGLEAGEGGEAVGDLARAMGMTRGPEVDLEGVDSGGTGTEMRMARAGGLVEVVVVGEEEGLEADETTMKTRKEEGEASMGGEEGGVVAGEALVGVAMTRVVMEKAGSLEEGVVLVAVVMMRTRMEVVASAGEEGGVVGTLVGETGTVRMAAIVAVGGGTGKTEKEVNQVSPAS